MIAALFIYDSKGDILISKLYRDGVRRNMSDVFRVQVITANSQTGKQHSQTEVRSPVLTLGSTSFIYIRTGSLWICAVTRSNQDCSVILEFLYNLEALLKGMFSDGSSNKVLNDEVVINNFSVIYELLDEVIEFGYPTNLELSYLKGVLVSNSVNENIFRRPSSAFANVGGSSSKSLAKQINTLNVTWRNTGIKYRRNEIFLNVDEKINVLISPQGGILRAYVDGAIQMKTHLSGMPECQFGFAEDSLLLNSTNTDRTAVPESGTVTLEDCKFHQCVELNKFDSDRVIQFIPPDGEFQLMSYNCLLNVNLPFMVYPQIQEAGQQRLQFKVRIRSLYPHKLSATNVRLRIPVPKSVVKWYASNSSGKSKYHPEEGCIIWKFTSFFGDKEHTMTGEVELASSDANSGIKTLLNWSRPPIKLEFQLDMFSSSGLTVKFLKVQEKLNYRTIKWVKYSTSSGSYDIRY